MLSVAQVFRLDEAIAPGYRALVLLATFGNMRWGELEGLRRGNFDLDGQVVRVVETVYETGQLVKGWPIRKSGRGHATGTEAAESLLGRGGWTRK